ncbi:MAG TPA: hypothetical protein VNU71_09000 [Burkholderiaceae bacterium]|nr:hypothetical protein [Burkholderiaceae bacterium]
MSARRRATLALLVALGAGLALSSSGAAEAAVQCRLEAPAKARAGAPLALRFTFTNPGAAPWRVLTWNTPFEPGWFGAFVTVTRDGAPLAYRGAQMKRGEPAADDYLTIAARGSRRAQVDLAQAFDLSRPGRYHVEPKLVLHDVAPPGARVPRSRDAHAPQPLACNPVDIELR